MSDAIQTERLTKYYGDRCVVDTVDLNVPSGCVYGLLGRNGAGKSTTIKMLTGMVQPSAGQVRLLGQSLRELTPSDKARIAYLAEGHPLYTGMTVQQLVRFVRAFYARWNEPLLDQVLDHFQLARSARIRRLSNGQRAQLSLAIAIAPDPELLILDDPTLGLDTVVRRDFLESLIHLIQREGRTILFSSHILSDVERVADRIGIMVDGVLRVDCPTDYFRESIRKLVLTFADHRPVVEPFQGLVSSRQVGNQLEWVVVNYTEAHRKLAESLEPTSLDVVQLNLEDAFIEYTRGPERPLPNFTWEPTHVQSVVREGVA